MPHAERRLVHRRARHGQRHASSALICTRPAPGHETTAARTKASSSIAGARVEFQLRGPRCQGLPRATPSAQRSLASGVRVLGRSFKYHRPRGVLSAAGHDVNALMQVRDRALQRPQRACRCRRGRSRVGTSTRSIPAAVSRATGSRSSIGLAPFLPVGFYYKAFHGKRWFPRWERMFRNITGLGQVDLTAPRRPTPKRYDFCDVLVIGAGPSGLAAALRGRRARRAGAARR